MMRMDHVAFEVSDLERSIDFFKATLGFTEGWRHRNEDEREECVFLSLGDVRLELLVQIDNPISSSTKPKRPYCPHLAIGVDNLNEALDRLNKNDVPLLRGPLTVEGKVRWLYFSDPDSNVIELVEWLD
ncbi:MAG: glyoxalase [Planctomycetaceae bacterium]|nr:glyoxalase [Planctomycetaceae bacterium]|tara:strand:- start:525 stop:911 length:387 start_codon:yes stop_codon:yes gene_type:complete